MAVLQAEKKTEIRDLPGLQRWLKVYATELRGASDTSKKDADTLAGAREVLEQGLVFLRNTGFDTRRRVPRAEAAAEQTADVVATLRELAGKLEGLAKVWADAEGELKALIEG